ncbi:hypothetical protein MJT46_011616 [Ovis ammon polii x Ovis aries]|nr:hypothetical protein MJT46_011616 [Ovis ammon polii x Ovis aries]
MYGRAVSLRGKDWYGDEPGVLTPGTGTLIRCIGMLRGIPHPASVTFLIPSPCDRKAFGTTVAPPRDLDPGVRPAWPVLWESRELVPAPGTIISVPTVNCNRDPSPAGLSHMWDVKSCGLLCCWSRGGTDPPVHPDTS